MFLIRLRRLSDHLIREYPPHLSLESLAENISGSSAHLQSIPNVEPMEKSIEVAQEPTQAPASAGDRIDHVDNGPNQVVEDEKALSDKDSAEFQGGVQRVRAITTVLSTQTLILLFVLYVSFDFMFDYANS